MKIRVSCHALLNNDISSSGIPHSLTDQPGPYVVAAVFEEHGREMFYLLHTPGPSSLECLWQNSVYIPVPGHPSQRCHSPSLLSLLRRSCSLCLIQKHHIVFITIFGVWQHHLQAVDSSIGAMQRRPLMAATGKRMFCDITYVQHAYVKNAFLRSSEYRIFIRTAVYCHWTHHNVALTLHRNVSRLATRTL